ncbi:unnamed protein product [Strongylus vulgaris]|uniref:Rhodanese domain-containing protein n=1 Tax=Strongylus vulgaris TaxID=40348 RepID=A0A3P7J2F6_STRVU|nr:unnamed protein product [Strongylus vulgaris]
MRKRHMIFKQKTCPTGSHLNGAKSVPLGEVASDDGLKPKEVILQALKNVGYDPSLPIVTACNGGVQASLLALALKHAGKQARVYNGSMLEIGGRAPELISAK